MAISSPVEIERHDKPAPRAVLWIAVGISGLAHLGVILLLQDGRGQPYPRARSSISQQIHLIQPAPVTAAEPVSDELLTDPVLDPPHSPAAPPEADDPIEAVVPPPPAPPSPAPQRRSILQSVDDYVANLPLSAEYLPQDAPADPGKIFSPALRRALRTPERGRSGDANALTLNNSTVADAYERVALDGKCFRLDDLGGGGGKRAWYPVKCNGKESTSDVMARGLREALDRR